MTNLADIAAEIRKHSPGALPESLDDGKYDPVRLTMRYGVPLPDDIAETALRDAMTADIAPHAILIRTADAYRLDMRDGKRERWFHDSDHGGTLGACHAAWKFARGIK